MHGPGQAVGCDNYNKDALTDKGMEARAHETTTPLL